MTKPGDNDELVDSIYAVAMEPERLHELVDIWQEKLGEIDGYWHNHQKEILKRHMKRAETVLSLVLENEDVLPTPLQEKLNSEPQAILALTMNGVIEALNPAAASLFGIEKGASIKDLPVTEEAVSLIRRELRRFSQNADNSLNSTPSIYRLSRKADLPALLITFTPWVTSGSRKFVLLKTTDFIWPDYLTPLIENAFDLTEAEAAVVKLIVEGHSVEKISQMRGTSITTVRFQIRSIYSKTSTNNQSEFIRMAIGLTTLQLVDKDVLTGAYQHSQKKSPQAYPVAEHRRLFSLSDGRILDYAVFGPKDGRACVYFHDEYYGDVWPVKLANYAIKNNLRIILPARPYFARSSPYPKGVNSYAQFSKDLTALLQYQKIKRAVYISQVGGGLYAYNHAQTYPNYAVALVNIAPMLPSPSPEDEAVMPRMAKFAANITSKPFTLRFMSKSGWLYHNRVGSRQFMESMITNTKPDFDIINDDKNADAIIRGFQFGTTNGHLAFYHDLLDKAKGNWTQLEKLECPMYNIIGSEDKNSRSKRADRAIAAGVKLEKIIAEGGGEMLMFSHPKLIIDTVVQAWDEAS